MPIPLAAAIAQWGVAEWAAATGIANTVAGTVTGAVGAVTEPVGDTGWLFKGPDGTARYPKEIEKDWLVGSETEKGGTFLRFFADGYIWNNECTVSYQGVFSNTNEGPHCYPNAPVPADRFMEVQFAKHGEELGDGLLRCGVAVYDSIHDDEGNGHNPMLQIGVMGKFDPVGFGDEEFGFFAYIDTHGNVWLGNVTTMTSGLKIEQAGNQIDICLNQ